MWSILLNMLDSTLLATKHRCLFHFWLSLTAAKLFGRNLLPVVVRSTLSYYMLSMLWCYDLLPYPGLIQIYLFN